ncbi:DsbC family protein [Rhodanobacter sp. DHG33]|uniref:DsbC family protein n=1 Tax=Rhodanobacter sp. DHG33 TaxID=2775921 RepID=UPI00177EDFD6|nr:DsbC family protein [Rhodanobacter sp. DHG33]MBD8899892.1 DsbC family protein [Rhodanobacter sp. DHG33]
MLKKLLLAACVGGFTLTACAADNSAAAAANVSAAAGPTLGSGVDASALQVVQQALDRLAQGVQVDVVNRAPLPGFYQVIASGQLVYVSTDGKYLLNGDLVDLGAKRNLNDVAWATFRKTELAKLPATAHIEYAPANPKYRITVFTDVTCPYCRVLHEHMAELNKAGIAVDYVAWPRSGVEDEAGRPTETYKAMVSAWCAADPKAALNGAFAGREPKSASCANPVRQEFELGVKLGVTGTPAIFTASGRMIGGYLTPPQLLQVLQKD